MFVKIVNYLFCLEVSSDRSVFAYSNQNGAKLGVLYAEYLPLRLLLVMSACVETNTLCTYTPTRSAITHSEGNPSLFTQARLKVKRLWVGGWVHYIL